MGVPRHRRHPSGLNQLPQPTRPIFSYDTNPESQLPEQRDPQEYHHPEPLELPKPSPSMAMPGDDMGSDSHTHHRVRFSEPVKSYFSSSDSGESSSGDRIHLSPPTGKTPKGEKEAVDELLLILVECMEAVNTKTRESLLRKFFSEIETDEPLERFIVERLRHSKVKAIAELREKLPASLGADELSSDGGDGVSTITDDVSIITDGVSTIGDGVSTITDGVSTFTCGVSSGTDGFSTITDDVSFSTRSIHESVEELTEKLERFKVRTLALGGGVVVNEEEEKK